MHRIRIRLEGIVVWWRMWPWKDDVTLSRKLLSSQSILQLTFDFIWHLPGNMCCQNKMFLLWCIVVSISAPRIWAIYSMSDVLLRIKTDKWYLLNTVSMSFRGIVPSVWKDRALSSSFHVICFKGYWNTPIPLSTWSVGVLSILIIMNRPFLF